MSDARPSDPLPILTTVEVIETVTDNERSRSRGIETSNDQDLDINHGPPPPLSHPPHLHSQGDVASRETLVPIPADDQPPVARTVTPKKTRWNDTRYAKNWCVTKNNYTLEEYADWERRLNQGHADGKIHSAIVAREVGESGTPHLQANFIFTSKIRQSGVHGFFGYNSPCMHLSEQGAEGNNKGKPPVAAFRYCMKGGDFYIVGANLHEIEKSKQKIKAATGRSSPDYTRMTTAIENGEVTTMTQVRNLDAELAARHDEYWRSLILAHKPQPPLKEHPIRPWQVKLMDVLSKPPTDREVDREVIFVVDVEGDCGKSWFTRWYMSNHKKSIKIGAEKRENASFDLVNQIIDKGDPDVVFIDASRARAPYISSPLVEEIKNGSISTPKYKSKTCPIPPPHVVVMTNEYPGKTNDKGLSNDRYTYLIIDKNTQDGEWVRGKYIEPPQPGASHLTPYNEIQVTPQSTLPNSLQTRINRAFKLYLDNFNIDQLANNMTTTITNWYIQIGSKRARLS